MWKKAASAEIPAELDTTSSKTVNYVRKNITEVEREQPDGSKMTMYEYDELAVKKEDWELFMAVSESAVRIEEHERALAGVSETTVAKGAHAVGEYITVDGVFCEVIAGICAGETISLGRNVKAVNIGSVLSNMKG